MSTKKRFLVLSALSALSMIVAGMVAAPAATAADRTGCKAIAVWTVDGGYGVRVQCAEPDERGRTLYVAYGSTFDSANTAALGLRLDAYAERSCSSAAVVRSGATYTVTLDCVGSKRSAQYQGYDSSIDTAQTNAYITASWWLPHWSEM